VKGVLLGIFQCVLFCELDALIALSQNPLDLEPVPDHFDVHRGLRGQKFSEEGTQMVLNLRY
jgi:hypothetical protein